MAKFFRIGTYGAVNADMIKTISCSYVCEMGKGFDDMSAGDIRFLKTDGHTDENGHFHRTEYMFAYQISTHHARKVTVFSQSLNETEFNDLQELEASLDNVIYTDTETNKVYYWAH